LAHQLTSIDALESRRVQAIDKVFAICHGWLDRFSDTYRCKTDPNMSFECSCMLLGALTKGMKRLDILRPRPAAPFRGKSFEGVCESIKSMESPTWHTRRPDHSCWDEHTCSLADTLIPDIDHVMSRTKGLVLDDFVDRGEDTIVLAFHPR
jgi:hypothetical protein